MRAVFDTVKNGRMTAPLCICAAGIAMMLFPGAALNILCIAIGAAVGITGLIKLYVFFASGGIGSFFGFDLFGGLALVAASVLLVSGSDGTVTAAATVCGVIAIINSVIKLARFIKLNNLGYRIRSSGILTAVLSAAAGLMLVMYPVGSVRSIGIAVGAVLLLIGTIYAAFMYLTEKRCREYSYPGVIEGKFTEC